MPKPDTKPNIIMILSDDHGYGDLSSYGGEDIQTPNIDRIGSQGMRFTQFYANSPVCSPSRASLMTGRYPDMVGVPGVIRTNENNSWGYFDTNAVTLPEKLGEQGYHSTIIGKWHLGLEPENHPCERGFDRFRGFLGDMMDDYYTHLRQGNNYMRDNNEQIDPEGHATDIFTKWAVETIRERTEKEEPYFLYLAYNAPHTPIQPPDEWVEKVKEREPQIREKRAAYVALVEHMDNGIGEVLNTIEETGTQDETLVIYASDNGGQLDAGASNGPLRGEKQEMYEGGIRVPCCAMWPGQIPAGKESEQTAMLMDLFPTLCDAADVKVGHTIDSRSILPLLMGQEVDFADRFFYWVRREGGQWNGHDYLGRAYHAVRHCGMKLLQDGPFEPLEMYDMSQDFTEENDLCGTDNPVEPRLRSYMQRQVQKAGNVNWQKG